LWASPDTDIDGWDDNNNGRGAAFAFGRTIVEQFLKTYNLKKLIRASPVEAVLFSIFQ
jgi:hypothetical protein